MIDDTNVSLNTLMGFLSDAAHKCRIDDDGDLYVTGDVDFPFWLHIEDGQDVVKMFTYIRARPGATHEDLLELVNETSKKVILPAFYCLDHGDGLAFYGNYFMSISGGIDRTQFISIARRFAAAFSYAINRHDPNDLLGMPDADAQAPLIEGSNRPTLQ